MPNSDLRSPSTYGLDRDLWKCEKWAVTMAVSVHRFRCPTSADIPLPIRKLPLTYRTSSQLF
jgi:hypothetical protein